MMTDLRALVARRQRERVDEHGVNTAGRDALDRVHAGGVGVNTLPSRKNSSLGTVFTRSPPIDDERVNTVPKGHPARERADEHGVNTGDPGARCRYCGEPIAWPAAIGLVFADGTAAHPACAERAEVERIRRRAANANTPDALADEAEVMLRPGEPSCP
jgi:hypothetical protein